MTGVWNSTAIVGIGATEFSRYSGRSELQLAAEAVIAALDDAGLSPADVDGMVTFAIDNNLETEVARTVGAGHLTYMARSSNGGGGACAPLQLAALAIDAGLAKVIVCYRAMNERSEYRFGNPAAAPPVADPSFAFHNLQGGFTPAARIAVGLRRYMHETGATEESFAHVAVAARRHAATNPAATFFGKPLSFEDYFAGRMIADPLRIYDCCQETDGAVAIVLTSLDRARRLRHPPALVAAAAQGGPREIMPFANFYREDIAAAEEVGLVARQLYAQARLTPRDIQTAVIYDHFGPSVIPALEACGFCAVGDGKDFVAGGNIEIGGELPVNTHGGQVGEAYMHGMNGLSEAVRQIRGVAVNQVPKVRHVLVTAGTNVASSGAILSVV